MYFTVPLRDAYLARGGISELLGEEKMATLMTLGLILPALLATWGLTFVFGFTGTRTESTGLRETPVLPKSLLCG